MKFQPLTLLVFLTILVSCGDDVGGTNRKNPAIERSNPGLGNEDSGLISSHMHRSRGTTILSVTEEIPKLLATNYLLAIAQFLSSSSMMRAFPEKMF